MTMGIREVCPECGSQLFDRKTNHIERCNNTLRQRISRLVCSTLTFSKKVDNYVGAIRYFICHYNLTRTALLG